MKKFYIFYFAIITILLCACFSPWDGDEGNLTINWGNETSGRFVTSIGRTDTVLINMTGPGETISQAYRGDTKSASFTVTPGTWAATVKVVARGKFLEETLLLMGIEQINVASGKNTSVEFNLYNAKEVNSWGNLKEAVDKNNEHSDFSKTNAELFILSGKDFMADDTITIKRRIIIVAEDPILIYSEKEAFTDAFFEISGDNPRIEDAKVAVLTLGLPGMSGNLEFSGKRVETKSALIVVGEGASAPGTLIMNDGVTLMDNHNTDGNGGGVQILGGTFTMNGGIIRNNSAAIGGGVYVANIASARLVGIGGLITENEAKNAGGIFASGKTGYLSLGSGTTIVKNNPNDIGF